MKKRVEKWKGAKERESMSEEMYHKGEKPRLEPKNCR